VGDDDSRTTRQPDHESSLVRRRGRSGILRVPRAAQGGGYQDAQAPKPALDVLRSVDRTIQIAGHMLRQSVMSSDMSYEDLMEDPKLVNLYANDGYDARSETLQSTCGFTPIGHQRLKSLLVAATAMIKRTAGG
jgi:hypothetical protein